MTEAQRAQVASVAMATYTGWRFSVREAMWTLGLGDEEGNPSLSRVFSAMFAAAAVHGAIVHERALTWEDIGMGFLAVCGYFGLKGLAIFGRAASRKRESTEVRAIPDAGPG